MPTVVLSFKVMNREKYNFVAKNLFHEMPWEITHGTALATI